jgi:ElaB/YqjD/DUF883 family membrane-anchored ribosome-binding protein
MAIAALIVAILSALATCASVWVAKTSTTTAKLSAEAARDSAAAAKVQAKAALQQAETQRQQLAIEKEQRHEEMAPVFEGVVRDLPYTTSPEVATHQLELRLQTPWPLMSVRLDLPVGSWVAANRAAASMSHGMAHSIEYPEPGRPRVPIRAGQPAKWAVVVAGDASARLTATAHCRGEYGEDWDGVIVPIAMERPSSRDEQNGD